MKINKILSLVAVSALTLGFSACIDDESTYGVASILPSLSVSTPAGTEPGEIPVVSSYIGSETVIEPTVSYTGTTPLTYEWHASTEPDNTMSYEFISDAPVFRHTFAKGGVWSVILKISDGTVGYSQEYEINVNRPFEKGYVLISNTTAGVGNLVFLKDMTAEEIEAGIDPIVLEDCISRVVEDPAAERLIGARLVKPSWPPTAKGRLMVSTSKRCYFLDPNSFTLVANLAYDAGFNATHFIPFPTQCIAFDNATKRSFTLLSEDMLAVEESLWKGVSFDTFVIDSYEKWGNINSDIAYINTTPSTSVNNRIYDYNVGDYAFCEATELSADEYLAGGPGQVKTIMIDYGEWGVLPSDANSMYFITRGVTGDINWTYYTGFDAYASEAPVLGQRKKVGDANSAIPAKDSNIVTSTKYNRSYYYNDNRVYVMIEGTDGINPLPSPSQWALEFSEGEEITCMTMDKTSTSGEELLIIATADRATDRGNVYFFNPRDVRTDSPGASPVKSYRNCADRITDIFYKKRI